ncbi:MAG: hypothetical protein J6U04_01945 [Salinivirgaceae bacterium]|nr:hypothetical protein [Salinivirgaceae bacterium]
MKNVKLIIGGVLLLTSLTTNAQQKTIATTQGTTTTENPIRRPHKCPKPNSKPQVSYNSASTVLSVSFPGNSQGGKVEIYRNGTKVVSTAAPAGASLSFVLRNYGNGDYTVIVSQGNMVVFSNNVEVK